MYTYINYLQTFVFIRKKTSIQRAIAQRNSSNYFPV